MGLWESIRKGRDMNLFKQIWRQGVESLMKRLMICMLRINCFHLDEYWTKG